MNPTPANTPNDLLETLTKVFPGYAYERDEYDPPHFTYHDLLQDFMCFFSANNSKFTEHQFKDFAALINSAVEGGGNLENAFGTCFLEHLGQVGARKPLSLFLSRAAKERLHA